MDLGKPLKSPYRLHAAPPQQASLIEQAKYQQQPICQFPLSLSIPFLGHRIRQHTQQLITFPGRSVTVVQKHPIPPLDFQTLIESDYRNY